MEQLLLRADEVAKALGLGRSKTYELMNSGRLPVVRDWIETQVERDVEEGVARGEAAP